MDDSRMSLSAEELLAELGWLRRLARSLVGPEGSEDDLVQETWLAASRVEGGVSRAWLVGTLRRLAARWHRSESRLQRRQGEVAKPEAVDVRPLVERSEMFGLVLSELRNLDEPFRTTLFLIYQEGRTVQETALQLQMPEDTIRWRRREGLARLRARLDLTTNAGTDWRGAFLPLLTLPSIKSSTPAASTAAAVGPLIYMGGSLMSWKVLTATALSALAVFLIAINWGEKELANDQDLAVVPMEPEVGLVAAPEIKPALEVKDEEVRRVAEVVSAPVPVPVVLPPGEPTLVVTVVNRRKEPVPGATVWIGEDPDPGRDSWLSDEEGLARIPLSALGKVNRISGMTQDLYGIESYLPQLHGEERLLALFPDADVSVLIVNESGDSLEGVPVGIVRATQLKSRNYAPSMNFMKVTPTDSNGIVRIRHVHTAFMFMGDRDQFLVGPAVLLRKRPDVELNTSKLPAVPIRIVLPPTAPLSVSVLENDGTPNLLARKVRLVIDPTPGVNRRPSDLHDQLRFSERGVMIVQAKDGVVNVPYMGLDLPLLGEGMDAEPTESTFGIGSGPIQVGMAGELALEPMKIGTEVVGTL